MAKKKEQKDMAQEQEQRLNFQQKLIEILELGKKKKNMLEYQEIADFFKDLNLDPEKFEMVIDYLEQNGIDVLKISNDDDVDDDIILDDEDEVEVEKIDLSVPEVRLITKEIEKKFQKHPFRSQDKKGIDATVLVKYFTPWGAATWLITEAEQQPDGDWMLYGYCTLGYEWEWGTLMLSELQALRGPFGLTTERDLYIGNNAMVAELAY